MNEQIKSVRDLASEEFDTRTLLRNAVDQAIERHYEDIFIVDVDSHHYETESFKEITQYMDNPVMRQEALYQGMSRGGITSADGSYQELRCARPSTCRRRRTATSRSPSASWMRWAPT